MKPLRCEVCETLRPQGDLQPNRVLTPVTYGPRTVLLCRAHASIAATSGVTTFEQLRELYSESRGNRSYVPRRRQTERMLRCEAGGAGRRATDPRV